MVTTISRFIGLLACLLLCPQLLLAQLVLVVDGIPPNTPDTDSIYVVGSFNDWTPGDVNYILHKQKNGTYSIRMPFKVDFEYKFTRGAWESVEASFNGEAINNRVFKLAEASSDTVIAGIVSWEDLPPYGRQSFDELALIVDEIPTNTPKDASIYIVGNFNDWHPGSPAYKLKKDDKGRHYINIPVWLDTLEYKMTRGDWASVEGRNNGQARGNRVYEYDPNNIEVHIKIMSWEDLDGDFFSPYTFILIFAAMQGFLLIMAINRLQDNNRPANSILSILILMISIALLARVSTYSRELFQWQPKLLLVPDLIFFVYGPIFLFYIQKLLTLQPKNLSQRWMHFIPAFVHIASYMPLFLMDKSTFISKVVDKELHYIFAIAGGVALIFNAYYWWRCVQVINNYRMTETSQHSFEENVQYLNTVMALKAFCLLVWTFTYAVSIVGQFTAWDMTAISEISTDAVWIVFSSITYFLGYFAMSQPEVFKHPDVEEEEVLAIIEKKPAQTVKKDDLAPMKSMLTNIMEEEKPYLNPKLTLAELAEMMGTNTHTLSKVINDGFEQNFFDYVNAYRVKAFKELIGKGAYKNQTLLGVALEVGFNSKTAFNRSFKKLTDMTPGKYLKSVEEEQSTDKD